MLFSMRKFLLMICATLTMCFTSCESSAQVVYSNDGRAVEYVYYDYGVGTSVVYFNSIPYYRYWINNTWSYRLVPRDRWHYIVHQPHGYYRPQYYHNTFHNHYTPKPQHHRPNTHGFDVRPNQPSHQMRGRQPMQQRGRR